MKEAKHKKIINDFVICGIYQTDSSTHPASELFQLYTAKEIRVKKEILYAFCKKGLLDPFINKRLKRREKSNINVTERRYILVMCGIK